MARTTLALPVVMAISTSGTVGKSYQRCVPEPMRNEVDSTGNDHRNCNG